MASHVEPAGRPRHWRESLVFPRLSHADEAEFEALVLDMGARRVRPTRRWRFMRSLASR